MYYCIFCGVFEAWHELAAHFLRGPEQLSLSKTMTSRMWAGLWGTCCVFQGFVDTVVMLFTSRWVLDRTLSRGVKQSSGSTSSNQPTTSGKPWSEITQRELSCTYTKMKSIQRQWQTTFACILYGTVTRYCRHNNNMMYFDSQVCI